MILFSKYISELTGSKRNFFFISFVLFFSMEILFFGTNINELYKQIVLPTCYSLFFIHQLYIVYKQKIVLDKSVLKVSFFLLILTFLTITKNLTLYGKDIFQLLILMNAILFVNIVPFKSFLKGIEFFIFVICIYSLFCYIIYITNPAIFQIFPVIENSSGIVYVNAFLTVISPYTLRLYGPFREPGVFQMFINLAFLFHVTNTKKLNILKILVYSFTLVLTYSTTGIFVYVLIVLYLVFQFLSKDTNLKLVFVLLLIPNIFIFIINYVSPDFYDAFFLKMEGENDSFDSRFASVVCNLDILSENPLLGVGNSKIMDLFRDESINLFHNSDLHNTNTFLKTFAVSGIIYGFVYLYGFLKFSSKLGSKVLPSLLIFIIFFVMYSGESLELNIINYIIIFYGFMH